MMSGNITVIYEKGVFRPLWSLNLPERTQLNIRIVPAEDLSEADKAYQVLVQAGLLQPDLLAPAGRLSDTDRLQAAQAYGAAGPLSDWVIAERDEG